MSSRIRHNSLLTVLSLVLILSFALSGCATPAPAAPTAAPAAPEPTKAPEPTAAPAAPEPTKAPEPTAVPEPVSKYNEAPMLAELVKAGTLPPVDERLPEDPYVIEVPEVGKYGGIWHRGFVGPSDRNGLIRIVNDGLVRFSIDGASVEMKYAKSVDPER